MTGLAKQLISEEYGSSDLREERAAVEISEMTRDEFHTAEDDAASIRFHMTEAVKYLSRFEKAVRPQNKRDAAKLGKLVKAANAIWSDVHNDTQPMVDRLKVTEL